MRHFVERLRDRTVLRKIATIGGFQTCQQSVVDVSVPVFLPNLLGFVLLSKKEKPFIFNMLEEAAKHVREAIMLGRTDIVKKLLEEVKISLTKGKTIKMSKVQDFFPENDKCLYSKMMQKVDKTITTNF